MIEPSGEHRVLREDLLALLLVEVFLCFHADDSAKELWPHGVRGIDGDEQRGSPANRRLDHREDIAASVLGRQRRTSLRIHSSS